MNELNKHAFAIITVRNEAFGQLDILVSRDITLKEIIHNLFVALNCDQEPLNGYYAKTNRQKILLDPNDTLRDRQVFDGDILTIL